MTTSMQMTAPDAWAVLQRFSPGDLVSEHIEGHAELAGALKLAFPGFAVSDYSWMTFAQVVRMAGRALREEEDRAAAAEADRLAREARERRQRETAAHRRDTENRVDVGYWLESCGPDQFPRGFLQPPEYAEMAPLMAQHSLSVPVAKLHHELLRGDWRHWNVRSNPWAIFGAGCALRALPAAELEARNTAIAEAYRRNIETQERFILSFREEFDRRWRPALIDAHTRLNDLLDDLRLERSEPDRATISRKVGEVAEASVSLMPNTHALIPQVYGERHSRLSALSATSKNASSSLPLPKNNPSILSAIGALKAILPGFEVDGRILTLSTEFRSASASLGVLGISVFELQATWTMADVTASHTFTMGSPTKI